MGFPWLLILDRCTTVLSGVFYGASRKSVVYSICFKHAQVCLLALSMTEHAWRSLRSGQTLRWHPCHDRPTFWVSLPLGACVLCDHMDPRPDGVCRGEWVWGGEGPPCAFHLLTGSLSPLPALFSIAWTNIHTDNFTSRKVWVLARICVCMYIRCITEKEILAFCVIYCIFLISGCFNTTIALLFESLHGEALGSAFFYFNSY